MAGAWASFPRVGRHGAWGTEHRMRNIEYRVVRIGHLRAGHSLEIIGILSAYGYQIVAELADWWRLADIGGYWRILLAVTR